MKESYSRSNSCNKNKIAIVIIGNPGNGKSSVIRALTGAGNIRPLRKGGSTAPIYRLIDRQGRDFQCLVIHSAPQERGVSPQNFLAVSPYTDIRVKNHDVLVLALEEHYKNWSAGDYIDILLNLCYDVRAVIISQRPLGQTIQYLQNKGITYIHIPYKIGNQFNDPFNVATRIRGSTIWPP